MTDESVLLDSFSLNSSQNFLQLQLLLMKRGGEIIYASALGNHSKNFIEYLESITGVPNIKDGYNPTKWMLEVTSMVVE